LIVASIIFYGEWSLEHLFILLCSVCFNYLAFLWLQKVNSLKRWWLGGFIVLDLLPLGYFKYSYFLHLSPTHHLLPLAISFFTFQQIAFLVDSYKKKIKPKSFKEYLFFVLFFPQLVAGPIVHYKELIPQILSPKWAKFDAEKFRVGIVLFAMGLFKKVVLADNLSCIADTAFATPALNTYEAWMGIFAYTLQIYFDFSGYADMAVGLGLLFGIKLPINFDSPYKSDGIIQFWRRWHITLSRFLRDYVYIPLGGNRNGEFKKITNLLITMSIGGIWHGAGWGFLLWGLAHGVFLSIEHIIADTKKLTSHKAKTVKVFFTFMIVTLLWVLFRADDISKAYDYYKALFDLKDFHIGGFTPSKEGLIATGLLIVWLLPNSFELTGYKTAHLTDKKWIYTTAGILLFISLKLMAQTPSKAFVYFNF